MTNDKDREAPVSPAIRLVNEADRSWSASPAVEARLRAEVRAVGRASRRPVYGPLLAVAAALAIIVAGAIWWISRTGAPGLQIAQVDGTPAPVSAGVSDGSILTSFLPLPFSGVPTGSVHLVRLEIPRQALVTFGFVSIDMPGVGASAMVPIDLLIGEDGLARAVRFVHLTHQE